MDLREAVSMLSRTPRTLHSLLAEVKPEWLHRNDGPNTWSAYDIAGHLVVVDSDNWLPRLRMILDHGTGKVFKSFDRVAMLGWDRESAESLLQRFSAARASSLEQLQSLGLTERDMDRLGRHPELGEVTVRQVLSTWLAHDLTHLAQVGEVLARRFRSAVGPYRVYMPALERVANAE